MDPQSGSGLYRGRPGESLDYKTHLLDWLEKHKKYPRRAKLRGYQGSAWPLFAVDRAGRLLEYRLVKSTGYRMLDRDVGAMIERASPVPPPPPDGQKQRFVFRVPVGFFLH